MILSREKHTGFTLLEVLIALAIFAIAASGILAVSNENIKNAIYLENRTLANFVAQKKISALQLLETEDIRNGVEIVFFAKKEWELTTEISSRDTNQLQKINVRVGLYRDAYSDEVLAELIAYIGKH